MLSLQVSLINGTHQNFNTGNMDGGVMKNFMPGMYVKELYLDKVEFAGMIANGRVFRGDKGRYITFLTLGVGNGQYIDVTIKKAFAYSDHDVVWGQGTIRNSNNSDYVECFDSKGFRLEKYINN